MAIEKLFERLQYPKDESAHLLGISRRELDYQLAQGAIKPRRVGRRVLIPRSELIKFVRTDHTGRKASERERTRKDGNSTQGGVSRSDVNHELLEL